MVRTSPTGQKIIILDIAQLSKYSNNELELRTTMRSFLTHELFHILLSRKHLEPSFDKSFKDKLKYIIFNEGLAHAISFEENISLVNWTDEKMLEYKKNSILALSHVINFSNLTNENDFLIKANSGKYWEKYAAISGLFTTIDFFIKNNQDINSFRFLFDQGPDFFWNLLVKNNSHFFQE